MSNFFVYKLNNGLKNEFMLNSSKNFNNFFIIEDIDLITPIEIIRLLKNDRKIILADSIIMDTSYLDDLQKLLICENKSYANNLFISKQIYIRTKNTKYYAELIKELDFDKSLNEQDIFLSDEHLNCAMQIKDLYDHNLTIIKLHQSAFLKNFILEKFMLQKIDINFEIKEIINSVIFFKKYLIESVSLFFEKNKETNICFLIGEKLSTNYKLVSTKNIGIISAIDFNKNSKCPITEINSMNIDSQKNCGWIDIVEIKNKVKEWGIEEIIIENINLYNDLEEIKVCREYGIKNYSTNIFSNFKHEEITPFFIKFDGWQKDIFNIIEEKKVPIELLYFLNDIRNLVGAKIISTKLNYIEVKISH